MKTIFLFLIAVLTFNPIPEARELFYLEGKININTADVQDLKLLPFIGTKKAENIIAFRKESGDFSKPEDIMRVDGIGKDTYQSIEKYISISAKTDLHYSKYKKETKPLIIINSYDGPIMALDDRKYFHLLTDEIRLAKKSILVCMYVFKTSDIPTNLANKVLKELIIAASKGIDVTVLLEENDWDDDKLNESNHKTAKKLKNAGVDVFFDNKRVNTHAKLIIIDKKIVFLGSHNLTHTALNKSNETSLMLDSEKLAEYFTSYVKAIIDKSASTTPPG